jgi:hypothetical protein
MEHAISKDSQSYAVESLLVDIRRTAHKSLSHLGEFDSTRICRALEQECLQLLSDKVTIFRAAP